MPDKNMTADKIIEHMLAASKRVKSADPLTGLPDNYICVIHPRHRHLLEQLNEKTSSNNFMGPLYGIPIYEENRAPQDRFEFMDLITYYSKYPPIFPKHYSQQYILWDKVSTMFRRWYIRLRRWRHR